MGDVELEAPEIEDLDEAADAYKRLVAVLVVLITLFGSGVAYLQAKDSNKEDVAARDAQRDAVAGLGAQVDASAGFAADLRIGSELDVQLQRQALNAARVNNSQGDAQADVHLAAAQRYAAVREAIAQLTPIDPTDPLTVATEFARGNESADAARLRQSVEAELANDHGGKADSYVAVITVLAVSLFLLGLSLTVQGRSRIVLFAPGVAIAVVCVGWTALIAAREVTRVSERAIQAAAEGQRLQDAGDFEGAIDAFDEAIDDSPDFAAAYARRAGARFQQGSAQIGQTSFISITSDEALDDALDDLDRALELGADSDVVTVADAGFFAFLDEDFDRSASLSAQAIELNDQLAQVWFNLGVAELARGDERAADRAYRQGRRLLEDAPDAGNRAAVLAGARTDLSVLRELLDGDDLDDALERIEAVEAELAAFEAGFVDVPCPLESCPEAGDVGGGAEIGEVTFSRSGAFVFAQYPIDGVEPGTPITTVWYVRTDDDLPFEQAALSLETVRMAEDGIVSSATLASFDPACPVAGEYLVRVYAGERLLGEAAGTVEPGQLGASFTALVDPIEGFEACVPEGFSIERADVTALDAFTGFDGGDLAIGLNVTPGAVVEGVDQAQVSRNVLTALLQIDESEIVEVTLQGRDLDGNFVPIPAIAGANTLADGPTAMAIASGPDAATRNITIIGSVDLTLLDEVIGLIQFTGLPVEG
jgi:tetratricopeptide (TPR) repeat protein